MLSKISRKFDVCKPNFWTIRVNFVLSKFCSCCQRASFISYNKVIPLQLDFVLQWNLICDRAHVGANVQAGYAAGMLVGSFVFGAISDVFGRRFCMLLCSVLAVRTILKDNTQDCEQSLFFFRFIQGVHARAGVEQLLEMRTGHFPPRALCHARGHDRLSCVSLDGLRNKRDCS